jgi:hypothetical protein
VRSYIRAAVSSLLSQQPVQGKAALDRIRKEMAAASFPTRDVDVESYMRARYLSSAKQALVDNLLRVLLKAVLRGTMRN